ncbi:MAG TPA: hypothetical protein VFY42_08470, partial [Gemmatimonadales bacterium]|nr:hypothetical protein [Gemmatimonadales bacterium]
RGAVARLTSDASYGMVELGARRSRESGAVTISHSLEQRMSDAGPTPNDAVLPTPDSQLSGAPRMRMILLLLLAAACRRQEAQRPSSQRERDSVIGASQLPGAAGIRGALRASDSAAARNARLDSVGH